MLISTVAFAEESGLSNMTYEEWLEEQKSVNKSLAVVQSDLEPVIVSTQKQEQAPRISQVYSNEKSGNKLLGSILAEKGKYTITKNIDLNLVAENIVANMTNEETSVNEEASINNADLARTAPIASLRPIIVNEESLVDGAITTDTLIAFLFNDTDPDNNTIVNRYVDGSAVNYILGEIDGGFVIQITDPGTYQLFYQVEDSAGEFSRVLSYSITAIEAPIVEEYQVFEGNFSSAADSFTYNFSVDFTKMSSASVCLVRKGYIGTRMEVLDENGNQVLLKGTGSRQAKNWGFIDKPSSDATVCNYTVVVTPYSYEDRASDYRIIIGDKNDTEVMMSGIENTVLLDQYYEAEVNLQNSAYIPNAGEYWYKYKRESTSVITILSDVSDIRFRILDVNTLGVMFDSAAVSDTHRTSFLGTSSWISAEKARLNTVVGTEYYLVVYSTNPTSNLSIRTGSMATAVGSPVITGTNIAISPETSATLPTSGYSTTTTCNVSRDDLPITGQVREVNLSLAGSLSDVERWKMRAPNKSSWINNPSSFWYSIDMNYKVDSSDNARLQGTWDAAFLPSSSGKGATVTPSYNFFYNYEYGD